GRDLHPVESHERVLPDPHATHFTLPERQLPGGQLRHPARERRRHPSGITRRDQPVGERGERAQSVVGGCSPVPYRACVDTHSISSSNTDRAMDSRAALSCCQLCTHIRTSLSASYTRMRSSRRGTSVRGTPAAWMYVRTNRSESWS